MGSLLMHGYCCCEDRCHPAKYHFLYLVNSELPVNQTSTEHPHWANLHVFCIAQNIKSLYLAEDNRWDQGYSVWLGGLGTVSSALLRWGSDVWSPACLLLARPCSLLHDCPINKALLTHSHKSNIQISSSPKEGQSFFLRLGLYTMGF